jgi:hypothetical protein
MRQANRSIFEDAQRIGQAIALIQSCQDPASPAGVRVAVIGYSKGTISTRVYLRSRQADLSADFPGEVALDPPGANPVSEFVAIAPPNHGLRAVAFLDTELPIRQLNDGVRRTACTSYNEPLATRFMSRLNGEANGQWTGAHETPGNRANGAPVADGTLFVAIYATGDRDLVGGESPDPDNDCNAPPRKQARNRGANAVNLAIDVPAPTGLTQGVDVHRATVKHAEVICRALYTVVNHRAPEGAASVCPAAPDGNPIIPFGTAITLVLDHSGSMGIPACPTCQSKQAVLRGRGRDLPQPLARGRRAQGPGRDHVFPHHREPVRGAGPGRLARPGAARRHPSRHGPAGAGHHLERPHRDGRRPAGRHPPAPGGGGPSGDRRPEPQHHPLHRRTAETSTRWSSPSARGW